MKRHKKWLCILLGVVAAGIVCRGGETTSPRDEVKLLTIGNSFSRSLSRYLPLAAKSAGCKLTFENIYIGAAGLRKHWENMEREADDPDYKYFRTWSYADKIKSRPWDFICIQQASHDSWRPETYMPYAKQMYDYIRELAPNAEIIMQQTWAYRPDDKRLRQWKIDQRKMYDGIVAACNQAAAELNIRQVPVGTAVQLARETSPVKYVPFNQADYQYPALPDMRGSYVGTIRWSKDQKRLEGDAFHLNRQGEFLQACVWFAFLYNRPVSDIKLSPRGMSKEEAEFIKSVAQKAVDSFKQVTH